MSTYLVAYVMWFMYVFVQPEINFQKTYMKLVSTLVIFQTTSKEGPKSFGSTLRLQVGFGFGYQR